MAVEIHLDIFGDVQVARGLLRFEQKAQNLRPVFEDIADDFLDIERKQFGSEGRYASGGWKPLNPVYQAAKVRRGLDPRILHATLAMEKSLTVRNAPGSIRRITRDTMVLGTAVKSKKGFPYPAVHQRPIRSPLPRRRPVELRRSDRVAWVKRIQAFIIGGWKGEK